jgi:hypothetical protein
VSDPDPLDDLAARVADDPSFLASALTAYQRRHGLTDLALAALLHADPSALTLLGLCRAPRPGEEFDKDIGEIAGHFGCDAAALRTLLEETAGPPPAAPDQ